MKSIYTYAIMHTDAQYLKDCLVSASTKINDSKIERFIEIVLKCVPKHNLPSKVYNYNRRCIRTLISANYLDDKVDYSYEETMTRFFNNQEDADKYTKTGQYSFSNSKSDKSDEYNISANYISIIKSYMTIDEWLDSEPVNE